MSGGPDGWILQPGPPFSGRVLLENSGLSRVLIGPNGFGKSRLLSALGDASTARVFRSLPRRLQPYAEVAASGHGMEGNLSVGEITELAERVAFAGAAESWIARLADLSDPRWSVRVLGDDWTLVELYGSRKMEESVWSFLAPSSVAVRVFEDWTSPDRVSGTSLSGQTSEYFTRWVRALMPTLESELLPTRNPLVARNALESSVSLLGIAERFCFVLATRTMERLNVLAGFSLQSRVHPEEGFTWEIRLDTAWFPYESASTAIRRWVALSAAETMRELLLTAEESAGLEADLVPVESFVEGVVVPKGVLPVGTASAFATQSSWVMMDEPEIHLFGSEALTLGNTLAAYSRSGRLVVATHSLELASRMIGTCEFLAFHEPGGFTSTLPGESGTRLLTELAAHGAGILSSTRILYVEGVWDVEVLETLFGEVLARGNVVLSAMHGVGAASAVASSVLQRMIGLPFGVMFDRISQEEATDQWRKARAAASKSRADAVRALRSRANGSGLPHEDVALYRLFANVIEAGMERQMSFVMHGLSDIFQVASPRLLGLSSTSWTEEGYTGLDSFKVFVRKRYGTDLGRGPDCRALVDRMREDPANSVDPDCHAGLERALRAFVGEA